MLIASYSMNEAHSSQLWHLAPQFTANFYSNGQLNLKIISIKKNNTYILYTVTKLSQNITALLLSMLFPPIFTSNYVIFI